MDKFTQPSFLVFVHKWELHKFKEIQILTFPPAQTNSRGSSSVDHLALNPRCETDPSVLSVICISLVSLVSGGGSAEPQ